MLQKNEIFTLDDRLSVLYRDMKEAFIRWDEVYAIHIERVRFATFSSVALIFDYDNGEHFEVGDIMEGWDNLLDNLDSHIPLANKDLRGMIELCGDDSVLTIYRK